MIRSATQTPHLLVDTHVHTRYSDGTAGVARIEQHCRARGLGLAVTDHNEIRGAAAMCERERAPVIPGIEVGTQEGVELLVYFAAAQTLEQFYVGAIEPYLRSRFMVRSWVRAADCVRSAKELGGYVSLAHPFAFGRKSLDYQHGRRGESFVNGIVDSVDAIELYNGGVHRQANVKAREYAATAGKRLTVGSDSHRLRTIGSCGTYLDATADSSPADLFQALTTADELRFKVQVSASVASLPTLGIIVLKHAHHFVRVTKWGRQA